MQEFMSEPLRQMAYQPFGDIRLEFPGHDNAANYRRALDLDAALASVRYQVDGVPHERQVFSSYPDQVLVIHSRPIRMASVGFRATIDSPHASAATRTDAGDQVVLSGQVEDGGVRFEARLRVRTEGGTIATTERALVVTGADSATLILAAASSVRNYRDNGADPAGSALARLTAVGEKPFATLRDDHVADHRRLFRRVALDLGRTEAAELPTDERLGAGRRSTIPSSRRSTSSTAATC